MRRLTLHSLTSTAMELRSFSLLVEEDFLQRASTRRKTINKRKHQHLIRMLEEVRASRVRAA